MAEPAAGGPGQGDGPGQGGERGQGGTGQPSVWSAATEADRKQAVREQADRGQPRTDPPDTQQPDTQQPATEQPRAEQPATEQPRAEQPATEQPRAEQRATAEPRAEERATAEPRAEERATEQPRGPERPRAEQARAGQARREPADRNPGRGRGSGREMARATGDAGSRPSQPRRSNSSGGDLLTDLQRWLIRSSAKNMRREIEGQVRRTMGGRRAEPDDVWGTATTEPPPDVGQAPECAWCPICRAARKMRESGPGLSSQFSGATDVVASAVQEAVLAFDSVLSRTTAGRGQPPADRPPDPDHADSASDRAKRAEDEPGDRR